LVVAGQTTEHEFKYGNKTFTFELPNDFRTSHFNYGEGYYDTFYRPDTIAKTDTTSLTLHFGSNVQIQHLSDSTFIVDNKSNRGRSRTQLNGRFWRELNLSMGINIYYQDATKAEKVLFDSIIWNFRYQKYNKQLTNTTEYNIHNLYTYSVNILLDSLSQNIEGTFILEGGPAVNVHTKFLMEPVFNTELKRIFNHKSNLTKEFDYLIGQDLIRLRLKSVYIENSRVKLPVFLFKSVFRKRNKSHSEIFGEGAWTFIFYLNQQTNFFELERIDKGIIL